MTQQSPTRARILLKRISLPSRARDESALVLLRPWLCSRRDMGRPEGEIQKNFCCDRRYQIQIRAGLGGRPAFNRSHGVDSQLPLPIKDHERASSCLCWKGG